MTKVIIDTFDGGHAEDLRAHTTNECEKCLNFNIYKNPHLLQPYSDMVIQTYSNGNAYDYRITDVVSNVSASGAELIALGQVGSADTNAKIFYKSKSASTWSGGAEDTTGVPLRGTLIGYKGEAHYLKTVGSDIKLCKGSGGATSDLATIASASNACKPFVHPEDNVLYIGTNNKVSSWDGSALVDAAITLPSNMKVVSLDSYGGYLVIGCYDSSGLGRSVSYLWGRDSSLTTLQGVIDWGEGKLVASPNIDGYIVGIMINTDTYTIKDNRLFVKVWEGGSIATVKEIDITDTALLQTNITPTAKKDGRFYFCITATTALFSVGRNKSGSFTISQDRYLLDDSTTPSYVDAISFVGDLLFVGLATNGQAGQFLATKFTANNPSSDYTDECIYKTTINPSMLIEDRGKKKQLKAVRVTYTGASSGITKLSYFVDGGSETTIYSATNAAGENVFETGKESDGKALKTGREFQFQITVTGNSKVKELYYEYETIETR